MTKAIIPIANQCNWNINIFILCLFITNNNVRTAAITTMKCERIEETIMRSFAIFALNEWSCRSQILFYFIILLYFYVIGKKGVHSMEDFLFGVRMSSSCQSDLNLASNAGNEKKKHKIQFEWAWLHIACDLIVNSECIMLAVQHPNHGKI